MFLQQEILSYLGGRHVASDIAGDPSELTDGHREQEPEVHEFQAGFDEFQEISLFFLIL